MKLKAIGFTRRTVILLIISAFLAFFGVLLLFISVNNKGKAEQISYSDVSSFNIENSVESTDDIRDELSTDNSKENVVSDVFNDTSSDVTIDDTVETIEHGWVINKYGYTYLYGDSGFEQFNYSNNVLERYAESLNNLNNILPQDSKLYNITVPVSTTFADIPREVYVEDDFYNKSQSAFVSTVESKLNDKIINIPIVSAIQEQIDNGEAIYFRTDNNWTSVAAYSAYVEFCKQANINAYSLNSFIKTDLGEYLGRFYIATESESMEENPDNFVAYSTIPSVKTTLYVFNDGTVYNNFILCGNEVDIYSAYDYFLGMPAERYQICTNLYDKPSLLIIGDSSAYPLVPYLSAHYSLIEVIDPQKFKGSFIEFINEKKFDDVITMCYSTNATSGNYIPAFNTFMEVNKND